MQKALSMVGFGKNRVTARADGRARADALGQAAEDLGAERGVHSGGNVNTGAFDPAEEICNARRSGRVGACGRCVWIVGAGFAEVRRVDARA